MMMIFPRDDSQVPEKDIPGSYNWWEAGRKITSQRGREIMYNKKFSKGKALRKGRSETNRQEEASFKFIQAEGNIKVSLLITLFR